MVKQAGARLVRLPLLWSDVETVPGQFNFSGYDGILAAFHKQGLRPVICLAFGNTLYGDSWAVRSPEAIAAFSRFAQATASRYQSYDVIWELWNEPNLASFWRPKGNAQEYMALLRPTVAAIRQADPTALVIGPALANTTTPFLVSCFKAGLLQLVDGVSVHPYQRHTYPEAIEHDLTQLTRLMTKYNDKPLPVLLTEWGYSQADTPDSLRADFIMREALMGLMYHIPVNIWFNFRNKPGPCRSDGTCYGIVDYHHTATNAYRQFKRFSDQLTGLHFDRRLPTPSNQDYCLLMTNGQLTKLVAWTTVAQSHDVKCMPGRAPLNVTSTPVIVDVNGNNANRGLR